MDGLVALRTSTTFVQQQFMQIAALTTIKLDIKKK